MHFHNILLEHSWPGCISTMAKLEMAKNVYLQILRDKQFSYEMAKKHHIWKLTSGKILLQE